MTHSRLHRLADAGQSVWSDQISRSMLESGELARLVKEAAVSGVTSNPTIFAGAITTSSDYDTQLGEVASHGADPVEIVGALMGEDIRRACDALRPVWERSGGADGFVSVEVDPELARSTEPTVAEAREWVKRIDRPNLLVKVPATSEGIPAIRRLIGEGISINVTLIFAIERYGQVMDAYLAGLEDFVAVGGDPGRVASVASFFVSRVDSEVDRRLSELGTGEATEMRGRAAIANAQVAYDEFLQTFRGPRWAALRARGARVQRPLWASTSTKDPSYRDTMYVDALVAPHTVNTMPLATITAYQDHGPAPVPFGPEEIADARAALAELSEIGIDYDDVVRVLEDEGVDKFVASWRELLDDVERKAAAGR